MRPSTSRPDCSSGPSGSIRQVQCRSPDQYGHNHRRPIQRRDRVYRGITPSTIRARSTNQAPAASSRQRGRIEQRGWGRLRLSVRWNAVPPGRRPTIVNAGTIEKTGGTGTTTVSNVALNNSGTLDVESGTLALDSPETSTGGTFTVATGAVLKLARRAALLPSGQEPTAAPAAARFELSGGEIRRRLRRGDLQLPGRIVRSGPAAKLFRSQGP